MWLPEVAQRHAPAYMTQFTLAYFRSSTSDKQYFLPAMRFFFATQFPTQWIQVGYAFLQLTITSISHRTSRNTPNIRLHPCMLHLTWCLINEFQVKVSVPSFLCRLEDSCDREVSSVRLLSSSSKVWYLNLK